MTQLSDKLQRAMEGSRELDGRVYCAVRDLRFHMWDGAGIVVLKPEFRHIEGERIKYYTTNLQDAVSLAPKGWDGMLEWWDGEAIASFSMSDLPVCSVKNGTLVNGKAATPALALCIAIIKAHESKAEAA